MKLWCQPQNFWSATHDLHPYLAVCFKREKDIRKLKPALNSNTGVINRPSCMCMKSFYSTILQETDPCYLTWSSPAQECTWIHFSTRAKLWLFPFASSIIPTLNSWTLMLCFGFETFWLCSPGCPPSYLAPLGLQAAPPCPPCPDYSDVPCVCSLTQQSLGSTSLSRSHTRAGSHLLRMSHLLLVLLKSAKLLL